MVAGHSLGEISALVASKSLNFEDGLKLVYSRAKAMQKACEANPSTMAAILGLDDHLVEEVCENIEGNSRLQQTIIALDNWLYLVKTKAIEKACEKLSGGGCKKSIEITSRRSVPFSINGACKNGA